MVSAAGAVFIVLLVGGVALGAIWIAYGRFRAHKLGLPPPPLLPFFNHSSSSSSSTSGGITNWLSTQVRRFRNPNARTATGAYEGGLSGAPSSSSRGGVGGNARGGRGGFGPLDPDSAWDSRVGAEADYDAYEEQELGLHPGSTRRHHDDGGDDEHDEDPYAGGSYNMNLAATPGVGTAGERGRSGAAGGKGQQRNPFDDETAEPSNLSLRGVSPRPIETKMGAMAEHDGSGGGGGAVGEETSPTERRSVFRENV